MSGWGGGGGVGFGGSSWHALALPLATLTRTAAPTRTLMEVGGGKRSAHFGEGRKKEKGSEKIEKKEREKCSSLN